MEAVIWSALIAVVIGCGVASLIWLKRRFATPTARPMPAKATGDGVEVEVVQPRWQAPPNSIVLPDILEFELDASVGEKRIRGKVAYKEGEYVWVEYFLSDVSWLGADKDEGDRLIVWKRQPSAGLEPKGKAPRALNGVLYLYGERGTATYSAEGNTGSLTGEGSVEYVDYTGPDGRYLSLERYDGDQDWEVSVGERVSIDQLRYTPPGQPVSDTQLR